MQSWELIEGDTIRVMGTDGRRYDIQKLGNAIRRYDTQRWELMAGDKINRVGNR